MVRRFIQYFRFPNRPIKGGDILDFQKGGNLRKGGGYDPPFQLWTSVAYSKSFSALPKITLLHGCLSRFWNCANGTKLCKVSQMFLLNPLTTNVPIRSQPTFTCLKSTIEALEKCVHLFTVNNKDSRTMSMTFWCFFW